MRETKTDIDIMVIEGTPYENHEPILGSWYINKHNDVFYIDSRIARLTCSECVSDDFVIIAYINGSVNFPYTFIAREIYNAKRITKPVKFYLSINFNP